MLNAFRERLQVLMSHDCMRPFTCSGNPYDCKIFIVGTNSATELKPFFKTYWSDFSGFLREKFHENYNAERTERGTRPRIEHFVRGAHPIPCLETNIFPTPSKRPADLPDDKKDTTIFEFLLQEIQPDALFLFSKPAIQYFQTRFNVMLYGDEFVTADVFEHKTRILRPAALPFIRRTSYDDAYDVGKKFKMEFCCQKD